MSRRNALACLCFVLAAGCASAPPAFTPDRMPAALDGGWTRSETRLVPQNLMPDTARSLNVRTAVLAHYSGPTRQRVVLYQMPSDANAFEMVQKWRRTPNAIDFQKGALFVVSEEEGASVPQPDLARRFAKALEAALP